MFTLYSFFKFLHVVSAIVWIGGVATLTFVNARLSKVKQPEAVQALSKESNFYSRVVVGPAAALTLVAGIATALQMGVSFSVLWIGWGFTAIFLSLILGVTFIRVTNNKLSLAMTSSGSIVGLQNRLALFNIINLLLLLSTVWMMVFKPTL
jgi:uncharacterized membrane protein